MAAADYRYCETCNGGHAGPCRPAKLADHDGVDGPFNRACDEPPRVRRTAAHRRAMEDLRRGALRDLLARAETYGSVRRNLTNAIDSGDSESIRVLGNEEQWAQGRLEAAALAFARLTPRSRRR